MPDQPPQDVRPGSLAADPGRPAPVVAAVRLLWLLVLLALAFTVLAVVYDDALADAWAGGQGLAADDTRVPPSFAPVVVVLFVTVASLLVVLVSFLQGAHNWARHCLAGTVVLVAVATLAGVVAGPPLPFVVFCLVSLVVDAAIVLLLYRPETSRFLAPRGA